MFQDIRKKSSSILVSLMFAAIILTFVISFGPGSEGGCSSAKTYAANVDGKIITTAEFRYAYNNLYNYYARMFKEFNSEMAFQYKLPEKALNGLIAQILMAEKADSLGLDVSDKEVREQILKDPSFQKNGEFNRDSYNQIVQFNLNSTVSEYESKIRTEILAGKLRRFLFNTTDVSNIEVKDEYVDSNEKIDAWAYTFQASSLKKESKEAISEEIKPEEIAEYLKKHESEVKLTFQDNVSKYSSKEKDGKTTFENSKNDVAKDLILKEKIASKMKNDAKKLLAKVKETPEITVEEVATIISDWNVDKKDILSVSKKSKFIQGVGFSPDFVKKLFEKKSGVFDEVFMTGDSNAVVAGIKEYKVADMQKFEEARASLVKKLKTAKAAQLIDNYVEELKTKANISINQKFMQIYEARKEQ